MYSIKKVSDSSGVSIRTLQYYDEIGLLSPMKKENGYRLYTDEDVTTLQVILFYKFLGFKLKDIKELLDKNDDDLLVILKKQLELMKDEKNKIEILIETLRKTIESKERVVDMFIEEQFKGFEPSQYDRYRHKSVQYKAKDEIIIADISDIKTTKEDIVEGLNEIFFGFSKNMRKGLDPTNECNLDLARKLHKHIYDTCFDCSKEAFSFIGKMYVDCDEFKNNIDQFGAGTAEYVSKAISIYIEYSKND